MKMATADALILDPNVGLIGISAFRMMSSKELAALVRDKSYVVHHGDQQLAVLISYERFLRMQEIVRQFKATDRTGA